MHNLKQRRVDYFWHPQKKKKAKPFHQSFDVILLLWKGRFRQSNFWRLATNSYVQISLFYSSKANKTLFLSNSRCSLKVKKTRSLVWSETQKKVLKLFEVYLRNNRGSCQSICWETASEELKKQPCLLDSVFLQSSRLNEKSGKCYLIIICGPKEMLPKVLNFEISLTAETWKSLKSFQNLPPFLLNPHAKILDDVAKAFSMTMLTTDDTKFWRKCNWIHRHEPLLGSVECAQQKSEGIFLFFIFFYQ